jgi:hypothetical protein
MTPTWFTGEPPVRSRTCLERNASPRPLPVDAVLRAMALAIDDLIHSVR